MREAASPTMVGRLRQGNQILLERVELHLRLTELIGASFISVPSSYEVPAAFNDVEA